MSGPKAQLEISADASGVQAGVANAKRSLADLGATAKAEGAKAAEGIAAAGKGADDAATKVSASGARVLKSLESQANRLTLTAAEYAKLRAETAGVSDAAAPFIARIEGATQPLAKLGVSAAQTAAAMRSVPAQFTDIVTSLQGGQAPLTVLLQQGGQLKDMFGGVGPAARALGGYIAGLVTPLTLAAGGVAALAVAMFQGSEQSKAYARAITLSGNSVGLTIDQLQAMAGQIARTTGTQGEAANALAKLAESGKIAGSSLADVGAAVVAMNRVLGVSVDEAASTFVKLSDEPTKASAKLNESMHYLNQTTYDRIRALEEQGRKEEAAALAVSTAANVTVARLKDVQSQVGFLSRFWQALSKDAGDAWNVMQGVGRAKTTGDMLADAQKSVADLQALGPRKGLDSSAFAGDFAKSLAARQQIVNELSRKALREEANAVEQGERAKTEAQKIGASDRLKALTDEVRTNADKRKKAIEDLNRDYKTLGKATSGPDYDKLVANINDKFKDPKGASAPKERAFQDDAATRLAETLKQQGASLREQLETNDKLTSSEKERAKFVQLIADLKDKKILTAEQKSVLSGERLITSLFDQNVAYEKQLALKEADAKLDQQKLEFQKKLQAVTQSLAASQDGRDEQYGRQLGAFGLSDRQRAQIDSEKAIRKEYDRAMRTANKDAADASSDNFDAFGSDTYKRKVDEIKASLANALAAHRKYYDDEAALREDWKNGASRAFANYSDSIKDVSGSIEHAFTDSFKGAEDALVSFVTTGKGNLKSLADSIISQLARIAIQQTITGPIAAALQGALGGSSVGSALTAANTVGLFGGDSIGALISLAGLGKKAEGGPVSAKVPYIVGEKGPELFVPGASGNIVPNGAATGGSSTYITINNTVGDVATVAMLKQAQAGTERRIAGALDRSQRYGGRLSS